MKKGKKKQTKNTGSYFHDWIDNKRVAFSVELQEWGRTFSRFGSGRSGKKWKIGEYKVDTVAIVKNYICPTVTETGSQLATEKTLMYKGVSLWCCVGGRV